MPENNFTFILKLENQLIDTPKKRSCVKFYALKPNWVEADREFPICLCGDGDSIDVTITGAPQKIKLRVEHNKTYFKHRRVIFPSTNNKCDPKATHYRSKFPFRGPKRWKVKIKHKDIKNPLAEAQTTVTATDKQHIENND